ncbi:MAG: DEAD/DEAH box helicase [Oceanospirillaceae bacterium]|nr:DEAD/DEAH box helicase [Oceanospirillaceae bacterium]
MQFSQLGLDPRLLQALAENNYHETTPIQAAAIPEILQGQDVLAGAQTGTGKTAAFILPVLQRLLQQDENALAPVVGVRALVLVPTRELAQQVHKNAKKYAKHTDLKAVQVYGGVSIDQQISTIKQGADILIATPGRLLDLIFKKAVDLRPLQTLIFDEADRMLDMGFADEIKNILRRLPAQRQSLLFSATLDNSIFNFSKNLLNKPKLIEVAARNATAEQVQQIVYNVDNERKRALTAYMIGSKNWQQVLIFTRTKQSADELAAELQKDGLSAQSFHADKTQYMRETALAEFKSGALRVLVATDVAARGIDISQLKYVINYELPYVAEDYIHRIGRTGRAGESGLAISLMDESENYLLEEIEALLDTKLNQQWYEGFEPDLNKEREPLQKNSKAAQKRRFKQRHKK